MALETVGGVVDRLRVTHVVVLGDDRLAHEIASRVGSGQQNREQQNREQQNRGQQNRGQQNRGQQNRDQPHRGQPGGEEKGDNNREGRTAAFLKVGVECLPVSDRGGGTSLRFPGEGEPATVVLRSPRRCG